MLILTGTMRTDVALLGTTLTLNKGQRVYLTFADNQPQDSPDKWFARPLDGIWPDGFERSDEDSILVSRSDVSVDRVSQAALQQIYTYQGICVFLPVWIEDDVRGQLGINITSEGIICDVLDARGEYVSTYGVTAQEIVDELAH